MVAIIFMARLFGSPPWWSRFAMHTCGGVLLGHYLGELVFWLGEDYAIPFLLTLAGLGIAMACYLLFVLWKLGKRR